MTSSFSFRLLIAALSVVLVMSAALRIQAAIWQYRVHSLLAVLPDVQLGKTSRVELLRRLPQLRPVHQVDCGADECLSLRASIWPDRVADFVGRLERPSVGDESFLKGLLGTKEVYHAAQWLGFRLAFCDISAQIRQGKLSHLDYWLVIAGADNFFRAISFRAFCASRAPSERVLEPELDDTPDLGFLDFAPDHDVALEVGYTPTAPPDLVGHLFDLRLNCMWQLGCRTVAQIVPETWEDKERIRRLPLARLVSSDPCPNSIIARRARDVPNILLLDVKDTTRYPGQMLVDYRLVRVLKGSTDPWYPQMYHPNELGTRAGVVPNPSVRWLRPGERVIMFTDGQRLVNDEGTPCSVIPATAEALKLLETELAKRR